MSFKAIILLKNREAVYRRASAKKTHVEFQNGVYVITETDIQNREDRGRVTGAEAIYFEGNPNAVGYSDHADKSGDYLDEIVLLNALKQTGSGPRFNLGSYFGFLSPLKDPVNLMYLLFGLVIVYGLIAGALGWV